MPPSVPKPCAWSSKAARPKPPPGRSTATPTAFISGKKPLKRRWRPPWGRHWTRPRPSNCAELRQLRAFFAQPPTPNLIVHSDRGGPYCGNAYRALLHQHRAGRSQSRRGECDDNAQAENRFKVLAASGPASKPRCSKGASGPFLPTWPMPKPASPTVLTTIITTACTPVLATRRRITLINNYFKPLP